VTQPTTLATLGNRRRPWRVSLLAALAATALSFGLIMAGSGTASASDVPPTDEYTTSGGWCTLAGWGGTFYCQDGDSSPNWYQMPNGYWQVFVVGTDDAVWTRWEVPGGLSSWTSLGGQCPDDFHYVFIADVNPSNGWNWAIACTSGGYWFDSRTGVPNGSWTGWKTSPET
jgi:hypothetical protein